MFAAALLAGGRSIRMGRDKAWLSVGGQPLWRRQVEVLRSLKPHRLFIAARSEQGLSDAEVEFIADEDGTADRSGGPLPAIARCLRAAGMPLLVLAVDMPRLTADALRRCLLDRFDGVVGVVLRGASAFEPLAAIYPPAALPLLEEAMAAGDLSLQRVLLKAVDRGLMSAGDMPPDDAALFRNVNTPDDIDLADDKFSTVTRITRVHRDGARNDEDDVIVREEPLEIRVQGRSVAVVMRTPGHDRELAAGFLVSEGVVKSADQIIDILKCDGQGRSKGNIIDVMLADGELKLDALTRHVFSASSCGLCGKTSIDSVFQRFAAVQAEWRVNSELLWSLPGRVRAAQMTFARTGGLHACAIFDLDGNLLVAREDVGRHNALDKVLGHAVLHNLLPFDRHLLLLSGRVSFEMMQKALAAGVPLIAAISAPSSLAVEFARESNQTLIGFLREASMNVYAHGRRIV